MKLEINRFNEMQIFVSTVELGGFSATAKHYQKSPSSISKLITRLETRLDSRLFNRSTRGLQLTEEGRVFYEQSRCVLSNLEEAERSVLGNKEPIGNLRISTTIPIGKHFLLPIVNEFLLTYPSITLDINLTEKVIDLMHEYTDIAIRIGPIKDSSLIARKLGESSPVIVGAPSYFKSRSIPNTPHELREHNLIDFNFSRHHGEWQFVEKNKKISIRPKGNIKVNDGESARQLALEGVGIIRLSNLLVAKDIKEGKLVPVLGDYHKKIIDPISAVFLGHGKYLPRRIRVFIDFLVAKMKI